jgi:transcriptional regulator with XRE-family HTH domain
MKVEELGIRLKEARKKSGFTQAQVSEITGISQVLLSYYETGKREISLSQLESLASLYSYQMKYFLEYEVEAIQEYPIAFRADQLCSEDFEVIEWAKRFLNNLHEMKQLKG